jgi:hypothetical protein
LRRFGEAEGAVFTFAVETFNNLKTMKEQRNKKLTSGATPVSSTQEEFQESEILVNPDDTTITKQGASTQMEEEPQQIDTEAELKKLQRAAVITLKNLLRYGNNTTKLRVAVWLLDRADKSAPKGNIDFGELRFGFDEDEYKDDY